jgi:ribonucleoside-diphosphate reductase alpha chain
VYQPTGLSETIFSERYTIHPDETWEEASRRLAKHVSSPEVNGDKPLVEERFYEEIVTNRFMPGGRVWYGSGRPRGQLLNCFVVPTSDSREVWGTTIHDVIVISGMGGGVGINCSPIRPRGSRISGTGGIATGAVSLMQMINAVGDVLVGGGGRRLALMLDLNITHPDILEFLDKKLDRQELTNANVSVIIDKRLPAESFIKKVRKGEDFDLVFGGTKSGKVNAKEIWEKIVSNSWNSGEPGVLNGDLANKESNIWYYKPLISTNPCGEIWLEEYGSCDLGALVLPRFVN